MKLAEALSIRKSLSTKLGDLRDRLYNMAKVAEGDEPAEEPVVLIDDIDRVCGQLTRLITVINQTNISVTNAAGETMTSMLARRDVMKSQIDILRNTFEQATSAGSRYSRGDLKYIPAIDVKTLREKIDRLSKKYRELDMEIQMLNFSCDLVKDIEE